MSTQTIRPGILVALKTSVRGGVRYERTQLSVDIDNAERWETTKIVSNPDELAAASKARSDAANMVMRACNRTSFGLLCPERYEAELNAAVVRAQDIVDSFNATARHTHVSIYVLKGRVAASDEVAAKAIAAEVTDLIAAMGKGIDDMDPKSVREAAAKARQMLNVLTEDNAQRVELAIEAARKAARDIVRRIEKKGEEAEAVLADIDRSQIDAARIAFLDMAEAEQPRATQDLPPVDVQRIASLDWTDEEEV
jgi:hypothetical protein